MELDITVAYIGPYQVYHLRAAEQIEATPPNDVVKGFRFLRIQPFPQHAIKRIRSFKVFPSIREALMDACCNWIYDDYTYNIDEKLDYFEINDIRYYPDCVPKIINFI